MSRTSEGGYRTVRADDGNGKPLSSMWGWAFLIALGVASIGVAVWGVGAGLRAIDADSQRREAVARTADAALANAGAFPLDESDSSRACARKSQDVGTCILSERTLREDGVPLWRAAGPDERMRCLAKIRNAVEPGARLYACLRG